MWFKRKRKPVKMEIGEPLEIYVRRGGLRHLLILSEISSDSTGTTAVFTDRWRREGVWQAQQKKDELF